MRSAPPSLELPPRLGALRDELDRIDDALHDLVMRRAEVVAAVGALRAKGTTPLRPGREAAILRRLLARNHGALAPEHLVRIWRALLNGFTAQQQANRIAVAGPKHLARAHFGEEAQLHDAGSATDAIASVAEGRAEIAVLPWPAGWWTMLAEAADVRVVAALPVWAEAAAPAAPAALVVTAADPDPSGHDRTLVAGQDETGRWRRRLEALGLDVMAPLPVPVPASGGWALAELDGFVEPERLPAGAVRIGAYAIGAGQPA